MFIPILLFPALSVSLSLSALTQIPLPDRLNPYPTKLRLHFNEDKTFKVTVFSDLHFGENPWENWGLEQDFNSSRLIRGVLDAETANFVVLNGDLITGENAFKENATRLLDEIVQPLNERGVPFGSTHGNHDNQLNITHLEEITYEQSISPLYSYTRSAFRGGSEGGEGNYWVPIYENEHDTSPVVILWFFDSRGGVHPSSNEPMEDWVDASVAKWIRDEVQLMDRYWKGKRESLAFVHIPPLVARDLQPLVPPTEEGGVLNDDRLIGTGSVQGTWFSSDEGKDYPWLNAVKRYIKPRAIVSGHDHGNEWCAPIDGSKLCFAKHSGYGGYDRPERWGHGVRDIVLSIEPGVDEGEMKAETWIRLEDGERRGEEDL